MHRMHPSSCQTRLGVKFSDKCSLTRVNFILRKVLIRKSVPRHFIGVSQKYSSKFNYKLAVKEKKKNKPQNVTFSKVAFAAG